MARLTIFAFLVVILVNSCVEAGWNDYVTYHSLSSGTNKPRVKIPQVMVEERQLPKSFRDKEQKWLSKKCVTTTYCEADKLILQESKKMETINGIVERINVISMKFQTGLGWSDTDERDLESLSDELHIIDLNLSPDHRANKEGSLIMAIQMDIRSILTYMEAKRTAPSTGENLHQIQNSPNSKANSNVALTPEHLKQIENSPLGSSTRI